MNRKHIIIAAISIVIIVVGAFGYMRWKKSPQYSLSQVKVAFENHDIVSFEKYVDIESVSTRYIDEAMVVAMEETESDDELDDWASGLAQGMMQLMKPQLVEMIEQQLKALIEEETVEIDPEMEENESLNVLQLLDEEQQAKMEYEGVENIRKDGNIAVLTLAFQHEEHEGELLLDVKMRKLDGYWQVAELPDALQFFEQIEVIQGSTANQ